MAASASVERVVRAAAAAGIEARVREFPGGTRTALDAARAVGCEIGQIVKSLVFVVDDEPVVALVSGAHRLDPARLAAAAGGRRARRASPEEARAATGYAVGGTPPLGHARPLRVFMDRALLGFAEVWCAAGTPTTVFPVDPAALARSTGAVVVELAAEEAPESSAGPGREASAGRSDRPV
jgi:Cys-tRNA(Pro) deacylase